MFDFYTLSVLVFILVLAVYVYRSRAKFKRESGIFLLRRTGRGKDFLERLGRRWPRVWKVVGGLGVALGFYFSAEIVWLLLGLTYRNLTAGAVQGLTFLLPSPSASATVAPGVLLVPFWYWIITIALLVIVHEGMHGILTARERVRIKSLGTGLLAVIPLAFVEPDEKQLQKKGFWAQQRVFAAGSFTNFVLAGFVLVLHMGLLAGAYAPEAGVMFAGVAAGSPASLVNLSGVIVAVDGQSVGTVAEMTARLDEIGPGRDFTVTVKRDGGTEEVRIPAGERDGWFAPWLEHAILIWTGMARQAEAGIGNEGSWLGIQQKIAFWEYVGGLDGDAAERLAELKALQTGFRQPAYMGVIQAQQAVGLRPGLEPAGGPIIFLLELLSFIGLINFGVGVFNLLPLKPLDGGRMWELVFRKISKRYSKGITTVVGLVVFVLIAAGFVLPLVR